MKRMILEIHHHAGDAATSHIRISEFPIRIGRGYRNDIIISDPHINPDHIEIDWSDDAWQVKDLGSINGLFVNGIGTAQARLYSGDRIRIGQTELRTLRADYPVPPTLLLQKANPLFAWLTRPINIWLSFGLSIATVCGMSYLGIWSDNQDAGMTTAIAAAVAACVILIWSAVWAAAGRLIKRKPNFTGHIALMSLYLAASSVLWFIESYVNFLTLENMFSDIFAAVTAFCALALLVYGSLSLATTMPKRRRMLASGFFSAGLLASIVALGIAAESAFDPNPNYPVTLEPYFAALPSGETAESFMKESAELFDSKTFQVNDKAAQKQD